MLVAEGGAMKQYSLLYISPEFISWLLLSVLIGRHLSKRLHKTNKVIVA